MSEVEEEKQKENIEIEDELVTFRFKRTHFYAFMLVVVYALGLASGYVLRGQENSELVNAFVGAIPTDAPSSNVGANQGAQSQSAPTVAAAAEPQGVQRFEVPLDDDPRFGPADAPITIIEFSDFQCPYCTRFHQETLGPLIEKYGDLIQFVYRDLPLVNIHPEAFPAAIAANCAGEQDAYWPYHNILFNTGSDALNTTNYFAFAESLSLDMDAFDECINSERWVEEIQADLDFAVNLGVRSTPTFFVNGIPIVGAQPFEVFVQIIDAELAGEN